MEDWLKGASALGKLREPLMPDDEEPPRPVKRLSTASKVDRVMQAAAEKVQMGLFMGAGSHTNTHT